MTEEELQNTISEIDRDIAIFSEPEKTLSGDETRRYRVLLMKKDVLEKIKQDKKNNKPRQEMQHSADYGLLCEYGERHPLLLFFMRNKFKWNIF